MHGLSAAIGAFALAGLTRQVRATLPMAGMAAGLAAGSYALPMPIDKAVPKTSAMAKRTGAWTDFEDFSKSFLEAFFKRDLESDATQVWDDVKPGTEKLANKVENWIDSRDLGSDAHQVWDDVKTDADKVKNKVEAWVDSRDLSSDAHQVWDDVKIDAGKLENKVDNLFQRDAPLDPFELALQNVETVVNGLKTHTGGFTQDSLNAALQQVKDTISTLTPEDRAIWKEVIANGTVPAPGATKRSTSKDGTVAGDAASFFYHFSKIFTGLFESAAKKRDNSSKDGSIAGYVATSVYHWGSLIFGIIGDAAEGVDK